MLDRLATESLLLAPDLESFKRQESTFVVLNLFVLGFLILIHTLFASHFGNPPRSLVAVLGVGFLLNAVELIWIQTMQAAPGRFAVTTLTCSTIALNMILGFLLAALADRQDTQYFVLMVVPILEAAFRFGLWATLTVVAGSSLLNFFWVWAYFRLHPPASATEYFEAGTVSLIYVLVGLLVWLLVNHLRRNFSKLEKARERLLVEEKLAAVGRLASAIAHEIRNPVAMISSSLATAARGGIAEGEREEMFEIAAKEASRLENLTGDFLRYARPRTPVKVLESVADTLEYVAATCRAHAAQKNVRLAVEARGELTAEFDAGQLHQALLNLVMNAVDASPAGGTVMLRAAATGLGVSLDVENAGGPIPGEAVARVFEPFFTTKPSGTGLGLAIARNLARGHGGDLVLASNRTDAIRFSLTLPGTPQKARNG